MNALTIDTGNPLANSGTLEATGGGKLIVDDNVSGGKTSIASASTVEFAGTLNNSAVSFQNNGGIDTGVFVLDHAATPDAAHGFHGTIAGFKYDLTHSDTLDLKDIKFGGSETWSFTENSTGKAGVLTVNDGLGDIATLNLQGHFLTANQSATSASSTLFALALDSGTGTSVTTSHHV